MTRTNDQAAALTRRSTGALAPWTPMDELTALRQQIDDVLTNAFGYTPLSKMIPVEGFTFEPPVEIHNLKDKVQLFAAVPGFKADEIQIETTGDTVEITGERKTSFTETEGKKSWMTGESRFSIQCTLPAEINPSQTKASVRDGMLTLELPKTEQAKTRTVKINVAQK